MITFTKETGEVEILIIKASDLYYIQDPDPDEEFKLATGVIAGVVVAETDDTISISGFYFPKDGHVRNVITVPKSVIYYSKIVKIPDKWKEDE